MHLPQIPEAAVVAMLLAGPSGGCVGKKGCVEISTHQQNVSVWEGAYESIQLSP